MMDHLVRTIRQLVQTEVSRALAAMVPAKRYGNVVEYNPKTHSMKVRVQPEGVVTNWLPISSEFIGNGFGLVMTPNLDDQVEIHFPQDGINEASVTRRLFDERNPPPSQAQNAKFGECYLIDKAGNLITMTSDGKINIGGHTEIDLTAPTIKITSTTAVNIKAPTVTIDNGGTTQAVKLADGSNSTVLKAQ